MPEQPNKPYLSRTIRDKIFCDLFQDSNNVLQFYRDFHPEDKTASVDDLEILTLENVLSDGPYNDLGFLVGDKLMVLVEAQTTWSVNIVSRMLFYLAETYRRYLDNRNISLYHSRVIHLPTPELYVVYTGDKEVPATISFTHDILRNTTSSVEITAHVVRDEGVSIAGQYVAFCKAYDAFIKLHGRAFTNEQAYEFILDCIQRGILPLFLQRHLSEVVNSMFTVFDKEKEIRLYREALDQQIREEGVAQGRAEGLAEGTAQGRAEGLAEGEAKGKAVAILQMASITGTPAEELLFKMQLTTDEHASVLAAMNALRAE